MNIHRVSGHFTLFGISDSSTKEKELLALSVTRSTVKRVRF